MFSPSACLFALALVSGGGLTHGPFAGHVGPRDAFLWVRVEDPGSYTLEWDGGREQLQITGASDLCASFHLEGLEPASEVRYTLHSDGGTGDPVARGILRTAPAEDSTASVRLVFGSCANDRSRPEQPIWARISEEKPDVLVLLGDTPYIDSTDIDVQRRRYREFFSQAQMAVVLADTPTYATWDDHDFGRNDTDGRLPGKENSRRAFLEYHANGSAGEHDVGIYTSFRRGPVEVFLLDTRWFAGTEPSWADPDSLTLLGKEQWAWLRRGLAGSDAPFKILACGMIWNGATRPGKTDHWGAYTHERDALFRWIFESGITGVVLVGGDIHRTRVVRHDVAGLEDPAPGSSPAVSAAGTTAGAGAGSLLEWITSPLANWVIGTANAPHPGLLFDGGLTDTCLIFDIAAHGEEAVLRGRIIDPSGKVHFTLEQKAPR